MSISGSAGLIVCLAAMFFLSVAPLLLAVPALAWTAPCPISDGGSHDAAHSSIIDSTTGKSMKITPVNLGSVDNGTERKTLYIQLTVTGAGEGKSPEKGFSVCSESVSNADTVLWQWLVNSTGAVRNIQGESVDNESGRPQSHAYFDGVATDSGNCQVSDTTANHHCVFLQILSAQLGLGVRVNSIHFFTQGGTSARLFVDVWVNPSNTFTPASIGGGSAHCPSSPASGAHATWQPWNSGGNKKLTTQAVAFGNGLVLGFPVVEVGEK